MRNILLIISIVASLIMAKIGLNSMARTQELKQESSKAKELNTDLHKQVSYKKNLKHKDPKEISDAFNYLVNQMNLLSTYSGTKMDIVFSQSKDKDSLENFYKDSDFKNVRILPITISINKFSKEAELTSILNSVYLLEKRTDFKVTEITNESTTISVKGELYGI